MKKKMDVAPKVLRKRNSCKAFCQSKDGVKNREGRFKSRGTEQSKATVSSKNSTVITGYTSLSPSLTQVAFVSGMNMGKFMEASKPLVDYKLL